MSITEVSIDEMDTPSRLMLYFHVWWKGVVICILGLAASYVLQLIVGLSGGFLANMFVTTLAGHNLARELTVAAAYIATILFGVMVLLPIYVRWLIGTSAGDIRLGLTIPVDKAAEKALRDARFDVCPGCGVTFVPVGTDASVVKLLKQSKNFIVGRLDHGAKKEDWQAVLVGGNTSQCPKCGGALL